MLRALVLGLCACASACYKPSYRDCAIACTADCPGDLSCDSTLHVCRLPGKTGACESGDGGADAPGDTLDPSGDADGDGVPNGNDNCPLVANTDQADEDTDLIGDVCDPCPIDAATLDSDGDGLPDACDPHPMKSGTVVIQDRIVRFEGYNAGTFGSGAIQHGTASIAAGPGVAQVLALSGQEGYLTYPITPSGAGITVFTKVTYSAMPAALAGAGPLTEVSGYSGNRAAGFGCEIETRATGSGGELDLFETDNQSYNGSIPITTNSFPGPFQLSVGADTATTSKLSCRHPPSDGLMGSGAAAGTFDVGLYAHAVNATFAYLLVVATGP